jgi:hypothetical protein
LPIYIPYVLPMHYYYYYYYLLAIFNKTVSLQRSLPFLSYLRIKK